MISSLIEKYCFINVYMPFQHDDNYEKFMECIVKISALIEDSDISNFNILGVLVLLSTHRLNQSF